MTDPLAMTLEQTLSAQLSAGEGTDRAPAPPPPSGSARYERLGELGRGGMGRVVEARDRQFGRRVAIKELHADASDDTARRFTVEALITGNLEHPGIPTVYERGACAGASFYAMRRVQGRTLAEAFAAAGSLGERLKLLPIVARAAQAVAYAHDHGVVHRDIKPQNIVVGTYGEAVVLDWGIAKVRGLAITEPTPPGAAPLAPAGSVETAHGSVLGTPAYMAPEQAAGDVAAVDERTDVFALGALLYHLLTGRPPYEGTSFVATIARASHANFDPVARLAPHAPRRLRAVCERAMARGPADRYPTATALAQALDDAAADALAAAGSTAVKWFANAASAAAVLILLVLAALMWRVLPSLREQGGPALLFVGMSVCGCALSAIDWRTRGRYRLAPLALSFALATIFLGLSTCAVGFTRVMTGVSEIDDPAHFLRTAAVGLYECAGSIASSGVLASLQIALWGVARRAALTDGPRTRS